MSFGTNQVKAAIISTYIVIKNPATVLYFSQTVTNRSILMQEGVRISSLLDQINLSTGNWKKSIISIIEMQGLFKLLVSGLNSYFGICSNSSTVRYANLGNSNPSSLDRSLALRVFLGFFTFSVATSSFKTTLNDHSWDNK